MRAESEMLAEEIEFEIKRLPPPRGGFRAMVHIIPSRPVIRTY